MALMINLLPYDQKASLSAARTNTLLLRYNIILIIAAGFLSVALGVVYFYLTTVQGSAEAILAENQKRAETYSQVKQEAAAFKSQLDDAKTMFDSDLSYSTALVRFADLFPSGTTISQMSLNQESFTKPLELAVKIRNKEAAQSLEKNMQTSPYVKNFTVKSFAYESGESSITWNVSFNLSKDITKQ